jgi:hypothetical protein
MPTAGNRLTVGGATSGTLGSVEVYIDSSPTIAAKAKTSGGTTTDAELLWAGYNRLGSQTTSIRTDGVPTNTSDLTTKSYVDTQVAGVTYREMMIVSCVGTVDSNFSGSNIITTGFTSATTSIVLATSSAFTVTSVSNVPGSTITWTAPLLSSRRRLAVSAGTWTILAMSGGPALTDGAVFHCIRTA